MEHLAPFILNHWLLFLALFIVLALLIMNLTRDRLLGFREIKPAEAVQLINHSDAVVLDIREQEQFAQGHIINAINIPLGALEARVDELHATRSQPIIVCCHTGPRAARASALLKKSGFESVYKLAGGTMAWESAHLPLTRE